MTNLDADLYRRLLESSQEGVVLVDAQDPQHPVVYVNAAFLALTGYPRDELLGRNLRLLQAGDHDQDVRQRLRDCLSKGESCHVLLRNYRKDGTLFWNEISVRPLRDAGGKISYFAGFHRDASERLRRAAQPGRDAGAAPPPPPAPREDRLTGLCTFAYLEESLKRAWAAAQIERHGIAVFSIDIDALELYNTTFGRAAGDSTIRRVAHCIAGCLRRASDVTARVDGGSLIAFAPGVPEEQALRIAQTIAERVRELRIHHPRSSILRYVSVSVGVAVAIPDGALEPAGLLQKARQRLQVAKESGRNCAA